MQFNGDSTIIYKQSRLERVFLRPRKHMVDFQTAFNIAVGALSGLAGWMLNNLHQSMKDLAEADRELASKVQAIEVLVAGKYIQRSEFDAKIDAMFHKLDTIEDKIDRKISGIKTQ